MLGTQVVQVGYVFNKVVLQQELHGLLAQRLDVHRLAADEVDDATHNLGAAVALVGAVVLRLALIADKFSTTLGAVGDVLQRLARSITLANLHARNLRDNLATLLHIHHIALAQVKCCNLVGIVECRALYGCACQQHGLKVCYRGNSARATNLIGYL